MRTTAQTAFLMAVLTLISKFIGFAREMVMANYFGTSYVTDAYVMAFTILSVLFGGVISAISIAYIPIYSKIAEQKGIDEGNRFTSAIINILLIITVIISLIGIVFSNQIISIFASGFNDKTATLASFYVKVLFSYVIFSSTSNILDSYLRYRGSFLPQIISGYFISICTIGAIVISAFTSYYYLAFGILIGCFLRFICMIILAGKNQYQYTLTIKSDDQIKNIILLALPTFVGNSMSNISVFVDKTMASQLSEGSISALNYAYLLNTMIMSLTITILTTIIYPKLSKANSLGQYDSFNKIVNTGIIVIFMISLPCSMGAMLYSNEIVHVVYERGAFDKLAASMTSSAFFCYSIGLVFMSANSLLTRVFYSMHNMRTPMIYSGIGVIINIGLNFLLMHLIGFPGLALSTSIAAFCTCIMLYKGLQHKYSHIRIFGPDSNKKIAKIAISSVLAMIFSFGLYSAGEFIPIFSLRLFFSVCFGGIAYLGALILFKIEEVNLIKQLVTRKKS